MFVIADSQNLYPINVEVYTGKSKIGNKPEDIVLRLVSQLGSGHVLVGDNFFTSLSLSKKLLEQHCMRYFGTLRKRRVEVPKLMTKTKGIPPHSSTFLFLENQTMVSYITRKNKNVILLSNYHRDKEISDHVKKKPVIIMDYNKYKSGVDILDMMLKGFRPY